MKLDMRGLFVHKNHAHPTPQRGLIDASIQNDSGIILPERIHDVLAD